MRKEKDLMGVIERLEDDPPGHVVRSLANEHRTSTAEIREVIALHEKTRNDLSDADVSDQDALREIQDDLPDADVSEQDA